MAEKLRQEINIIDAQLTSTGTLNSNAIVRLDTARYSGTPTYYFEAVYKGAASNTGTIKLRRSGTTTDDASLTGATSTTIQISRSTSFTPPTGLTEYIVTLVGDGTRSQTAYAARIVILQNETPVFTTETQVEIGNEETGKTNTVAAALTTPKYWKYTAANWDVNTKFYVEVVWTTSAKNTTTITLQKDSAGTFASFADDTTVVSAGSNSTGYFRQITSFTPTDGRNYRIATLGSTTKSNYSIASAKIVIDQSAAVSGDTTEWSTFGNLQNVTGGTGASVESLQAIGQSFTATASYSTQRIDCQLQAQGTLTDNLTLEVLTGSMTGTVIATSDALVGSTVALVSTWYSFTFASSFSITSGTKYYLRMTRTGARDSTNKISWLMDSSNPLANGGAYTRDNNVWSAESTTNDQAFRMVAINAAISKLEPQFLLLNTTDSNVTGNQSYLTTWNSLEWNADAGTITYKHAIDSDNASNAAKITDVTSSSDIANSSVSGANQQISSALGTLTNGDNLDCNVTNTTGVIAASRIIVLYSYVASSSTPISNSGMFSVWP